MRPIKAADRWSEKWLAPKAYISTQRPELCSAASIGQAFIQIPMPIRRHLRGGGHYFKSAVLKEAVDALAQLPLKSRQELRLANPSVASQPVPVISQDRKTVSWWF